MKLNIEVIVYICTTVVTVFTAGGIILKGLKSSVKRITEEVLRSEMESYTQTFEDGLREMSCRLKEFISSQDTMNSQTRRSLLASTRDRINQAHDYYTRKKFIGSHSLFVVEELYASYKELGGNSFIDRQMEDIRELEVRSAETASALYKGQVEV